MIKRALFFILAWSVLRAIPQDELLQVYRFPSGTTAWVRENSAPRQMASVRVVWNSKGTPVVCTLDTLAEEIEELEEFFDQCCQKIDSSASDVGVIAVGDFSGKEMASLIEHRFQKEVHEEPFVPIKARLVSGMPHVDLTFAYQMEPSQSFEDLRQLWRIAFFQGLVHGRLERSLKASEGTLAEGQDSFFSLPRQFFYARAKCTDINYLEVLSGFLAAIQEVKKSGFSEEEFIALKTKIQKNLLTARQSAPESSMLAAYYVDHYLLGDGCPNYTFFVDHSLNLTAEICLRELHELVGSILLDERRFVELIGPPSADLSVSQIQETLDLFKTDALVLNVVDDQEAPSVSPVPDGTDPFLLLAITDKEAEIIWKVIDTMANNNPVVLIGKMVDLKKKGKKIEHIHPLRFLARIFSDPYLKSCMEEIYPSYFKRVGFMDGLSPRMEQEYSRNNLYPYVAGFCRMVKANPEQVKKYIQDKDWDGLVRYLMKLDS